MDLKTSLVLILLSVVVGCVDSEHTHVGSKSDVGLFDGLSFRMENSVLPVPHEATEFPMLRFLPDDSLVMNWNPWEQRLHLWAFPGWEMHGAFSMDTLHSSQVVDVLWNAGTLYLVGRDNEVIAIRPTTDFADSLDLADLDRQGFRAFTTPTIPLYVEDSVVYLGGNLTGHSNYLLDEKDRRAFFSSFLEIGYHLKTEDIATFGKYPESFVEEEMEFYRWFPSRQRLNGRSIYSFAHVDSITAFDNESGRYQTVKRKSVLRRRPLTPLDKTRLMDYSYLGDYHYMNDRYAELIADPFRNLIYSIFRPGVEVPEERRLSESDIAFTILVYDSKLNFLKEAFFPAGHYNPAFHLVTQEGLWMLATDGHGTLSDEFHGFDFTDGGLPLVRLPEVRTLTRDLPDISDYLRRNIGVSQTIDSIVVISGLGCTGCLESMIMEAESKALNLNGYAFVAGLNASRVQTIDDFLSRYDQTYIDSTDHLIDYRAIGDFLTLVVLDGDSVVAIDDKFGF